MCVAPRGRFDAVVRIPGGELRPGFVNAHDHLHRNHYGRLGTPPYVSAYDWGRDIHARCAGAIAAGRAVPRHEALLEGAWKNLFAGATTVVHHDRWEPVFDAGFPLRVARVHAAHSLGFEPDAGAWSPPADGRPFTVHVAEGVDAASEAEVPELARRGLVNHRLLAVHVVGAGAAGGETLRAAGAAVVWCPSSNEFLFGTTAPAALLAGGIDVLLGTDSLLTGCGTLLDELRYARTLGVVGDAALLDAVGATAARRLGLAAPSLAEGARADLVVLRRPPLEATTADVALVVCGGVPRVADPALAGALEPVAPGGRAMRRDGVTRWVFDAPAERR